MNLHKQVEPLCQAPTLGFLAQRHAHTGVLQFTSIQQWLKRASKPSRAMQGKLPLRHRNNNDQPSNPALSSSLAQF